MKYNRKKVYIDDRGYYRFIGSNKLVHRWAMEKYLGIKLKPSQIVHHKNGNKRDNRVENLQVIMESNAWDWHNRIHKKNSKLVIGMEFRSDLNGEPRMMKILFIVRYVEIN